MTSNCLPFMAGYMLAACTRAHAYASPWLPYMQAQAQQQQDASDNTRVAGVIALTAALAFATELNQGWIADHQELAMGGVFALGYVSIIIEDLLGFSKAGVALMLGAALWGIRFTTGSGVSRHSEQRNLICDES